MSKIPAASIGDLDLRRFRRRFPAECAEIARLGELLDVGAERSRDLVDLAILLVRVGESERAEELLRCNVVSERGVIHRAYVKLFGRGAFETFKAAIHRFSDDFMVAIRKKRNQGFLRGEYRSRPRDGQRIADPVIRSFLGGPATAEFHFDSKGTTADVSSDLPELLDDYIVLQLKRNGWTMVGGSSRGR